MSDLIAIADRVLAPTYVRPPVLFTRGQGCWLYDDQGNDYLDMTTGIAVTSLGHGSGAVREALHHAADGLIHTSNLFHTEPAIRLAEALTDASFAEQVFFCNSGAEAVEGALKFARLARPGRHEVVYFDQSFHGRTFGALAATDKPAIQQPFLPLVPGFRRAPFNDDEALAHIDTNVAAVIVEPIQGEGGARPASDAWLRALRARCDATGALLIADEIQCGLGRTGTLWAHEPSGIFPDILTLAKPLAGGLPIGAILLGPAVTPTITPSCHGTTFGGGPVVATVALAVFERLRQPELLAGVRQRAETLRAMLTDALGDHLVALRGRGLLLGVQVDRPAKEIMAAAFEQRLLVVPAADDIIRILPPLDAPMDDLAEAVRRLALVVTSTQRPS